MSRIVPPWRRRVLVRATAQAGCYKARIPIPAYWDRELERTGPGSRLATGRRLRGSPGRALVSATTCSLQHVQLAVVRTVWLWSADRQTDVDKAAGAALCRHTRNNRALTHRCAQVSVSSKSLPCKRVP